LSAARRNAVPAACLAVFALSIGLSYAFVPPVREAFDAFADWRRGLPTAGAWLFPAVSTAMFAGVIPWAVQRLRPDPDARPTGIDLLYFTGFWAIKGLEVQLLYYGLDRLVGSEASVSIIAVKVLLDMGLYCPFYAVPTTLLGYQFRDAGYRWSRLRRGPMVGGFGHWVRWSVLPVVVNNWCVWLPAVVVIYTMPLALQLPFQNLVLCFWALVLAFMSDALSGEDQAMPEVPEGLADLTDDPPTSSLTSTAEAT
jgi:hypothetical protein